MASVQPYFEFVQSVGGLSNDEFFKYVKTPYLYFPNLPELESPRLIQTLQFKTLRPQHDTPTHDTPNNVLQAAGLPADLGQRGIARLQKDEGLNVFSSMVTIGRAQNNDVVVPDKRVSKFHSYFREMDGGWTVTDANSTNGTEVEGLLLQPERSHHVRSGSSIVFSGVIECVFLEPRELLSLVRDFQDLAV